MFPIPLTAGHCDYPELSAQAERSLFMQHGPFPGLPTRRTHKQLALSSAGDLSRSRNVGLRTVVVVVSNSRRRFPTR